MVARVATALMLLIPADDGPIRLRVSATRFGRHKLSPVLSPNKMRGGARRGPRGRRRVFGDRAVRRAAGHNLG